SQPAAVAVPEPSTLPSNATQPLTALDLEPADDKPAASSAMMNGSVPEIDINELAERSEGSGEIDITDRSEGSGEIDVSVEEEAAEEPVAAAPPPPTAPRQRAASVPPPHTPQVKDTTSPIPRVTPPQAPPQAHLPHGKDKDPHAHPPPTPAKTPPSPPPKTAPKPAAAAPAPAKPEGKAARGKPWFVDLFDEDYLRTLPFLTPQATQSEAEFVIDAMGLSPGAQVLDVGCGYGRHAMELAARGFHVVGLDMSTPLLVRGGEEATRRGLEINFIRGDMRELDFDAQFDGAYCLFSTFGYFDDETNKKTVTNIARALKPGGRMMIEILNRDYIIADLPTRVWWEGEGCVVLEEVELNYFSSRIQVNRSVVFDDGRQLEQEISVRAYSLHEVGKLLHSAGFRVLEVSGGYHTRGRFFGNQSRHIIVLAERKDPAGA
ncbi:MAG TPA: methyltransferase domain-containing protein, partial [Kofleriaceae bacterium]|nr:methyltransferase domain-containing protein [Kofleriaceae bacterium]